jgi:hypothetical protein
MKKLSIVIFVFTFAVMTNGFAQTATITPKPDSTTTAAHATDFYAGKWEVTFIGTPQGDAKLVANFTRVEGRLEGVLSDPTGTVKEAITMTSVDEGTDKITFNFKAQGYDIAVDLEKVDDDNLKGMMMNMFESKAKRVK